MNFKNCVNIGNVSGSGNLIFADSFPLIFLIFPFDSMNGIPYSKPYDPRKTKRIYFGIRDDISCCNHGLFLPKILEKILVMAEKKQSK